MGENENSCISYTDSITRMDLAANILDRSSSGHWCAISSNILDRIAESTTDFDDMIAGYLDVSYDLRAKIAERDNDNSLGDYFKVRLRESLLEDLECTESLLRELSKDEEVAVRAALARHPRCPEDLLYSLSEDEYAAVRYQIAENPNTSLDLLCKLMNDKSDTVRMSVTGNPKATAEMLASIYKTNPYSRESIVVHPNTPDELYFKLATDKDPDVRAVVARNPRSSPEILTALAKDKKDSVLLALSENPILPDEVIKLMTKKKTLTSILNHDYFTDTRINKKILQEIIKEHISPDAFDHPNILPEDLELYARSEDAKIRQKIAQHPNTPIDNLIDLLKDEDIRVSRAALENPAMPEQLVLDYIDSIGATEPEVELSGLAVKTPSVAVQRKLMDFKNTKLCLALSKNRTINHEFIESVFFGQ